MKTYILPLLLLMFLFGCSDTPVSTDDTSIEKEKVENAPQQVNENLYLYNDRYYKSCGFFDDEACVDEDEEVTLFESYAYVNQDLGKVVLHVRGWIYESDANFATRFTFLSLLETEIDNDNLTEPSDITTRIDPFLSSAQEDETVTIQIGLNYYNLNASSPSGNFSGDITLSSAEVVNILNDQKSSDTITYRVVLTEDDTRIIEGKIHLVVTDGVVVISDIDDTVKVSEVYISDSRLLENTFYNPARIVEGMDTLFDTILADNYNVSFHFVSGSPKQLHNTLTQFLDEKGFKVDAIYLKEFVLSPTASELYEFFDENATYNHKLRTISKMFEELPNSTFILVGDTGEKDPEVYSELYSKYGAQIETIYLQNVTDENSSNVRMQNAFGSYADQVILLDHVK